MKFLRCNYFSTWLCILFTLCLLGCGNKGDLYLPDDVDQVEAKNVNLEPVDSDERQDLKQDDS